METVSWTLTMERLWWKKGLFSRTVQGLELYRTKDIALHKPFLLRFVRRGYVDFRTSDPSGKQDRQSLGVYSGRRTCM